MEPVKLFDEDVIVVGPSIAAHSVFQQLRNANILILVIEDADLRRI